MNLPPASSLVPAPRGSALLDRETAERALHMVLPMIEPLLGDTRVFGTGFGHIVVLDPGIPPGLASGPEARATEFEQALLLEHSLGDPSRWDADYTKFARDKARLSWRLQADASRLQRERPQLLQAGETLLGGAVWLDGLTVAFSGAMPWFDDAFALAIAGTLRALAQERHAEALGAGHLHAPPPGLR